MQPADLGTEYVRACTKLADAAHDLNNLPSDFGVYARAGAIQAERQARMERDTTLVRYTSALDRCQCGEIIGRRAIGEPFCRQCELLLTEGE